MDDATLLQTSVWSILRHAWGFGVRKKPWHMRYGLASDRRPLLSAALEEDARRDLSLWHPLYREYGALPPGKFEHAYVLTFGVGRAHVSTGHPVRIEHVAPLMSQPVMELALRTPMHFARIAGRDRSIARMAFSDFVPASIIWRRSKVLGDNTLREAMRSNSRLARELLLDGWLVREGFLDGAKLKDALLGRMSRVPAQITELCDYLSVEAWTRKWCSL